MDPLLRSELDRLAAMPIRRAASSKPKATFRRTTGKTKATNYRRRKPTMARWRTRGKVTKDYADLRICKNPNPHVMRNLLRYQDYLQTNTTANNLYRPWAINHLYDVDTKGYGASPPQFNTLITRYDHWRVNYVTFKHNIANLNVGANNYPMRFYYVLQLVPDASMNEFYHNAPSNPGFLFQKDIGGETASGARAFQQVTLRINIRNWLKKLLYPQAIPAPGGLNSLWGVQNTPPATQLYLLIYTQSFSDGAATTFNYQESIDITFDTTWAQVKTGVDQYDNIQVLGGTDGITGGFTGPTGA